MSKIEYSGRDNLEVMLSAVNYNNYLVDLVLAKTKVSDVAVDFGAGSGTFSVPLVGMGISVISVEPDPFLFEHLKSCGLNVVADIDQIADSSVDYIYSLNVLEHIEDDCSVLTLWLKKLKPGGGVFVYVPAFQVLYSSMDRKVGHFRRYRMYELRRKLRDSGFEIVESRYADCVGFAASLAYKFFDKGDGCINPQGLRFYDRWLFPVSRFLDIIFNQLFGKNVYVRAVKSREA